jgi:preprotein translocase subunit SecG
MVALLMIVFTIVCLLLIVFVLLQPHHSEGLASAFGGSSDSFFGTKAIPTFWKVTIALATIFILLAVTLNKLPQKREASSSLMGTGGTEKSSQSEETAPGPAEKK